MDKDPKSQLKEWLDKLQQESWQLELIISGFAIFLILGMNDPINQLIERSIRISFSSTRFGTLFLAAAVLKAVWAITLLNLVIHLALRSLWISTIGLRYVSRDIDYEQLKLIVFSGNAFVHSMIILKGWKKYAVRSSLLPF
jgi:hypothetical protein